ncbi:MAG: DUF134 domain-containing protein [Bacteroidales bacterium]|nr:DUF134 domain-containing protein [Bacteroidales bacterium]
MARPYKCRKISNPPKMRGFDPVGMVATELEPLILKMEEFESLRLLNFENLSQDDAACQMGVSRPTLTRIYNNTLKKLAYAFVQGTTIFIEGGHFKFEKDWCKCKKCFRIFESAINHKPCVGCTDFGDDELISLNYITGNEQI